MRKTKISSYRIECVNDDNRENRKNPRSNSNNSNITSRKAKKILVISKFTRNFQKKLQFF